MIVGKGVKEQGELISDSEWSDDKKVAELAKMEIEKATSTERIRSPRKRQTGRRYRKLAAIAGRSLGVGYCRLKCSLTDTPR